LACAFCAVSRNDEAKFETPNRPPIDDAAAADDDELAAAVSFYFEENTKDKE
jgi:hypothetical protein